MATPHESAQSLMKLYDLRREEKMREARHWYIRSFNPASLDDVSSLMQTEESATYVRMVLSCLLYTSPSPRDRQKSRMPSSA